MDKSLVVGVLMGGLSTERAVSMKSGKAVLAALTRKGWKAEAVVVGRDLPQRLISQRIDVAWIALHGRFGEDGCVQGLLEVMGIPYTGPDVRCAAVTMDKIATKQVVHGHPDVVMARDWICAAGSSVPDDMSFPVVVKPSVGGSTIGIQKVEKRQDFEDALAEACRFHPETLVEEFVAGDEITVAVLDGKAMPVVRILPESGFFDFEAKYTDGKTVYEVPAQIEAQTAEQAQTAACVAYELLNCRGLARADFIVRHDGVPVFLELNTIPGMTETSLSPMSAAEAGLSFDDLVEHILLKASCMPEEQV